MRYVIYGAGAIGCAIGAELADAGYEVVLIARGQHLEALREGGLIYQSRKGEQRLRISTVAHPDEAEIRDGDRVFLCMKSQHTLDALRTLCLAAPPSISVICAQNGVENERSAQRFFSKVYGLTVRVAAVFVAAGKVENPAYPSAGILDLGRYPGGIDTEATSIAQDLSKAGFSSRAVPNIMRWKYAKLLQNVGTGVQAAFAPSQAREHLLKAVREEAEACLHAAEVDHATAEEMSARRKDILTYDPQADRKRPGGSTWQSLARKTGSVEVDFLNGEIVLLGRLHGFATPINEEVQRALWDTVRCGAGPGRRDAAEVWDRLKKSVGEER